MRKLGQLDSRLDWFYYLLFTPYSLLLTLYSLFFTPYSLLLTLYYLQLDGRLDWFNSVSFCLY